MKANKLTSEIFPGREFTGVVPSILEVEETLKSELSYKFNGFFSDQQVEKIVDAFYAAQNDWVSGFGGQQYSLGEAWYHYVETGTGGNPAEYLDRAVPSRDIVERHITGLHDYVLSFLSKLHPDREVKIRDHWAGPGIVTFLANNYVAKRGGGIHFDTDGLTQEELKNPDFRLRSYVSTLQKPKTGGDLRLWDYRYDDNVGEDVLEDPKNYSDVVRSRIIYEQGDLCMFDGLKAHKIEAFEGDKDRVCLTFHTAERENKLEVWF
jgi:hypothetical protein